MKKVRNIILVALVIGLFFCTSAQADGRTVNTESLRARGGIVIALDNYRDMVIVEDCVGFIWSFHGIYDWEVGDGAALILLDVNGTDIITDDQVIGAAPCRLDILVQINDAWK